MVGLAIVSVLFMSMLTMIQMFQKEVGKANEIKDLAQVRDEMEVLWSDPVKCQESLGGSTVRYNGGYAPSSTSTPQRLPLRQINGVTPARYAENNRLLISEVDMKLVMGEIPARSFVGRANLIPRSKSGEILSYIRPQVVLLYLTLDGSNRISSCVSKPESGGLVYLDDPILITSNSRGRKTGYIGPPADMGFAIPEDSWTTVNLNSYLPVVAERVLLRIYTGEVNVYGKPRGSRLVKGFKTLLSTSPNNGQVLREVWMDVSKSGGQVELLYERTDPPTFGFWISIIAYE